MKNELLKNLGIVFVLGGVGSLVYHFVAAVNDNVTLLAGLGAIILGIILFVIINKRIY